MGKRKAKTKRSATARRTGSGDMKPGDLAVVIKSWSSDILPGTQGVIVKRLERGYALNVSGYFTDATGRGAMGTRCMYFARDEVQNIVHTKNGSSARVLFSNIPSL